MVLTAIFILLPSLAVLTFLCFLSPHTLFFTWHNLACIFEHLKTKLLGLLVLLWGLIHSQIHSIGLLFKVRGGADICHPSFSLEVVGTKPWSTWSCLTKYSCVHLSCTVFKLSHWVNEDCWSGTIFWRDFITESNIRWSLELKHLSSIYFFQGIATICWWLYEVTSPQAHTGYAEYPQFPVLLKKPKVSIENTLFLIHWC